MAHIEIAGLHVHVGSQITEIAPFEIAYRRAIDLLVGLRAQGQRIPRLDLGGGIGVAYRDGEPGADLAAYGAMVARLTRGLDVELVVEPGRLIVADAGVLVSRVIYVKPTQGPTFVILDAGMNDLIRPALYDSFHEIRPVAEPAAGAPRAVYELVGPICESSDTFARARELSEAGPGDLMAIMTAGAYGATMASTYNSRVPAAEVLVKGPEWAVVKARPPYATLFEHEQMPPWLG
jgi:diaminopimelate decarboxylase